MKANTLNHILSDESPRCLTYAVDRALFRSLCTVQELTEYAGKVGIDFVTDKSNQKQWRKTTADMKAHILHRARKDGFVFNLAELRRGRFNVVTVDSEKALAAKHLKALRDALNK